MTKFHHPVNSLWVKIKDPCSSWEVVLTQILMFGASCGLVIQLSLALCNLMDCSPPGSSVHLQVRILQVRILEWVTIPFSRGSSWPRDWTWISCNVGRFCTIWVCEKVPVCEKAHPTLCCKRLGLWGDTVMATDRWTMTSGVGAPGRQYSLKRKKFRGAKWKIFAFRLCQPKSIGPNSFLW